MKAVFVVLSALFLTTYGEQSNPLSKVFQLMDELEAKIVKEGEQADKAYKDFFEWCDETSHNLNYEIKTAKKAQEKLEAKIEEEASNIDVAESKIEDLAKAISTNEGELKEATGVREKEAADFAVAEKELMETVDTLGRAISIIESEMAKGGAALAQIDTSSMQNLVQSLSVIVDAASFTNADHKKLVAFVQEQQEDEDDATGAPAAAVYKSQSGGIVDVLADLKEKAETELAEARKDEATSKHNYDMMKQSLDDQMAYDNKELDAEKSAKEAAGEAKATAEGELSTTVKELKEAEKQLEITNSDCMTTAADHEASIHSRKAELKVLAEAKKILQETTKGAEEQTYSFLQVASKMMSRTDLKNSEVLTMVKKLAHDHHSAALAQLASQIAVVARYGGKHGKNPFEKVKGLIEEMISKLEKEAEAEATEKAYCDEEMAKTTAKKEDLQDGIAKLTTKIDQAAAQSTKLKDEVVELQKELAAIASEQAELDKIRAEQNAAYKVAKEELTEGLGGVRKALEVLRSYYGADAAEEALIQDDGMKSFMQQPAAPEMHAKNEGAGGSIIDILEVCESDFADNLAKEESEEADSAANYEKVTQENKVSTAEKSQDVKYKTQEAAALDKSITELTADKDTASNELDAVLEYDAKIKERCVAKPETYEERKARRDAEIDGLKEALSILENEAAFMQRSHKGHKRAQFLGA